MNIVLTVHLIMITIEQVVEYCQDKGRFELFDLVYIKLNGEQVQFNGVKCLGVYKADTMRIEFSDSKQVRRISLYSIIEFNGHEVIQ